MLVGHHLVVTSLLQGVSWLHEAVQAENHVLGIMLRGKSCITFSCAFFFKSKTLDCNSRYAFVQLHSFVWFRTCWPEGFQGNTSVKKKKHSLYFLTQEYWRHLYSIILHVQLAQRPVPLAKSILCNKFDCSGR